MTSQQINKKKKKKQEVQREKSDIIIRIQFLTDLFHNRIKNNKLQRK